MPHPVVLGVTPGTQNSFLAGSADHMGYFGLNSGRVHARQAPHTLYYLSSQGRVVDFEH